MTWRFENINEEDATVHSGLMALSALFATAVTTALAVYFLL